MTTKISAIIAQHIATQTRLIIPEVGTLIRRKESGEIVFTEMLKKSDGILAGLIVNTLDVSPSKANELLNSYITTIKTHLATQKKFILDGVGVLLARPDGSIDFSFNPFAQSLPEPERGVDILEEDFIPAPKTPATPVAPKEPVAAPAVSQQEVATPQPKAEPKVAPRVEVSAEPKAEPKKVVQKADVWDDEEEMERPAKRTIRKLARPKGKKVDALTIVALVAVAMALLCLIWGAITPSDNIELEVEQIEQVAE